MLRPAGNGSCDQIAFSPPVGQFGGNRRPPRESGDYEIQYTTYGGEFTLGHAFDLVWFLVKWGVIVGFFGILTLIVALTCPILLLVPLGYYLHKWFG